MKEPAQNFENNNGAFIHLVLFLVYFSSYFHNNHFFFKNTKRQCI